MREKKGIGCRSGVMLILSAAIPLCLMLIFMVLWKVAPFGNETLLLRDSYAQYIDYLSYFNTIFTGENDLFYTFSKNLGGDVISLASYYLISPFSLLFALATPQNMPYIYTAVMLVKLSCCGLTCYYALKKQFGEKYSHLLFSTAYALMAYNLMYGWSIMWLDGVMILPLMGYGIYRIWTADSYGWYIFSLAYALATNFYIGYMLCIASVMFSVALFFVKDGPFAPRIRTFGKYIGASCVGGFGTAFVWLPAFLSLQKGRVGYGSRGFGFEVIYNPFELAAKLIPGAGNADQLGDGIAHIFCGTVTVFLVLVFFLRRDVPLKKRAAAFVTALFLGVSFFIRPLDLVWHGFSPNLGFNHRYSFIFSYVLIMIAQYGLPKWRQTDFLSAAGITVVLTGMLAYVWKRHDRYVPQLGIIISLMVVWVLFFAIVWKTRRQMVVGVLAFAVCFFEIGANCFMLLDSIVGQEWALRISSYNDYIQSVEPAIDYVKERDAGFYRMEKTFSRTQNDAMMFAYNGLSHYSSTEPAFVHQFAQRMGFRNNEDFWSHYNTGSTAEVDALLGVKYVLSREDLSRIRGYEHLTTINGIGVYENRNVLPIAMVSEPGIEDVDMQCSDYFALHNTIWQGLTNLQQDILLQESEYTCTLTNLTETTDGTGSHTYTKIDSTLPASICYNIRISQEKPLYFYFAAPGTQNANVFINGVDDGVYFGSYRWDISAAGVWSPGETVTIEIVPNGDAVTFTQPYFYYEDLEQLAQQSARIRSADVNLEQQTSSRFTGRVSVEEEKLLLFTIPYDNGWQVRLDDEIVPLRNVMDAFFAVEVGPGEHTFSLRYIPNGTYAGCALTVMAIAAAVIWYVREKKSRAAKGV